MCLYFSIYVYIYLSMCICTHVYNTLKQRLSSIPRPLIWRAYRAFYKPLKFLLIYTIAKFRNKGRWWNQHNVISTKHPGFPRGTAQNTCKRNQLSTNVAYESSIGGLRLSHLTITATLWPNFMNEHNSGCGGYQTWPRSLTTEIREAAIPRRSHLSDPFPYIILPPNCGTMTVPERGSHCVTRTTLSLPDLKSLPSSSPARRKLCGTGRSLIRPEPRQGWQAQPPVD